MARNAPGLSDRAEDDLDDIFRLIAINDGVARAEAVLLRIEKTIGNLAAMPGMGHVLPDIDGKPLGFPVWSWMIIYEPQPDGHGIEVLRVIHGRRDLPRHLKRGVARGI